MSGVSESGKCPACDGEECTVYRDCKPFDRVSLECLECGFFTYTQVAFNGLAYINSVRGDSDLLPLTSFKELAEDTTTEIISAKLLEAEEVS
jgi:hypothetical protein